MCIHMRFNFPEPSENELQTRCSLTPKYFSMYFLKTKTFTCDYRNQKIENNQKIDINTMLLCNPHILL